MTNSHRVVGVAVTVSAALAAWLGAGAVGAASANPTCNPAGSTSLVGDRFVRVYSKSDKVYACLKSNGTTRLLLHHRRHEVFGLADKWVVWTDGNHPEDFASASARPQPSPMVNEINVRTGAAIYRHRTGNGCDMPAYGPYVIKIVVVGDGAFAYSLIDDCSYAPSGFIEATVLRHHAARQLAPSAAHGYHFADVHSLHVVRGRIVGWTLEDGTHQQLTLY